jgi:hypothetical protein
MSKTILDIFDNENKVNVLVTCFENYISKCNSNANRPLRGNGSCEEIDKKEEWRHKADFAERLLSEICEELN